MPVCGEQNEGREWPALKRVPLPPAPPAPQVEGAADGEGDVPRPVGLGQPEPRGLPHRRQRGGAAHRQGEGPALI